MSYHTTHARFEQLANDFYCTVNNVHAQLLHSAVAPQTAWDVLVLHEVALAYNKTYDIVTEWLRRHPFARTPPIPAGLFVYANCHNEQSAWKCDAHVNVRAAIFFSKYDRIVADGHIRHTDGRLSLLRMLNTNKATLDEWVSCFRAINAEWPFNPSSDACFQVMRWGESCAGGMAPFMFPGGAHVLPPSTMLTPPPVASHAGARGMPSAWSAPARGGASVKTRYRRSVKSYGNTAEIMFSSDDDTYVFEGYGQVTDGETELRRLEYDQQSRADDTRVTDEMLSRKRDAKICRLHAQNPYVIEELSAHLHDLRMGSRQPFPRDNEPQVQWQPRTVSARQ